MNKVFSGSGKSFIFLSFLSVFLISFDSVAAQTKTAGKNFLAASKAIAPSVEIKYHDEILQKKSDFIIVKKSPNPFRTITIEEKNASEQIGDYQQAEESNNFDNSQKNDFAYQFRSIEKRRRRIDFKDLINAKRKNQPFQRNAENDNFADVADDSSDKDSADNQDFQWKSAFKQSLVFLAVQHGYAIGFQAKTRRDLKHGAFFRDYVDSVKSLHGWNDGGRFFTNYIAHPMQGSLTGFIYVQNNPKERKLEFNESSAYWKSRLKAFAWTTAWSTQFEIGPISQASIGNVGLHGKQTWEDIIVTPTAGTMMLIGEDAIDRFITRRIERNTSNRYVKIFARMLLSPTRNFSNMLRLKEPWYRDRSEE